MGAAGAKIFSEYLKHPNCLLQILDVSFNFLTDEGCMSMVSAVQSVNFHTLCSINLKHNSIKLKHDDLLLKLRSFVKKSKLLSLDLSD